MPLQPSAISDQTSGPEDPLVRRLGRFRVSRWLLRTRPSMFHAIFAQVVIVDVSAKWEPDCVEYLALSAHFETLPEGTRPPLYEATFRKLGDVTTLERFARSEIDW